MKRTRNIFNISHTLLTIIGLLAFNLCNGGKVVSCKNSKTIPFSIFFSISSPKRHEEMLLICFILWAWIQIENASNSLMSLMLYFYWCCMCNCYIIYDFLGRNIIWGARRKSSAHTHNVVASHTFYCGINIIFHNKFT
jgi:hypothetical protein